LLRRNINDAVNAALRIPGDAWNRVRAMRTHHASRLLYMIP